MFFSCEKNEPICMHQWKEPIVFLNFSIIISCYHLYLIFPWQCPINSNPNYWSTIQQIFTYISTQNGSRNRNKPNTIQFAFLFVYFLVSIRFCCDPSKPELLFILPTFSLSFFLSSIRCSMRAHQIIYFIYARKYEEHGSVQCAY